MVYHPQSGTLTMNGGTLTGQTGIQLCSGEGELSIDFQFNGGKVEGVGPDLRADKGTGDGAIGDGAAISLVNRDYPGGIPTITISGGTFTSAQSKAVLAYTWSGGEASDWADAGDYLSISGGSFGSDVKNYCAFGYTTQLQDGMWAVVPTTAWRPRPDAEGSSVTAQVAGSYTGRENADGVEAENNTVAIDVATGRMTLRTWRWRSPPVPSPPWRRAA